MDATNMLLKLVDKNGNDITAQQAYDAAMSGPVYVFTNNKANGNYSMEFFIALDFYGVMRENENIISTTFTGFSHSGERYHFYAGQNPNDIVGGGHM